MNGRLSPERATHGRPFRGSDQRDSVVGQVAWGGGRFAPLLQAGGSDPFGVQSKIVPASPRQCSSIFGNDGVWPAWPCAFHSEVHTIQRVAATSQARLGSMAYRGPCETLVFKVNRNAWPTEKSTRGAAAAFFSEIRTILVVGVGQAPDEVQPDIPLRSHGSARKLREIACVPCCHPFTRLETSP